MAARRSDGRGIKVHSVFAAAKAEAMTARRPAEGVATEVVVEVATDGIEGCVWTMPVFVSRLVLSSPFCSKPRSSTKYCPAWSEEAGVCDSSIRSSCAEHESASSKAKEKCLRSMLPPPSAGLRLLAQRRVLAARAPSFPVFFRT